MVPISTAVYATAFAGALGGSLGRRSINSSAPISYDVAVKAAGSFAAAFDAALNVVNVNSAQLAIIQQVITQYWLDRAIDSIVASDYAETCNAIIATLTEAELYLAATAPTVGEFGGLPVFDTILGGLQAYDATACPDGSRVFVNSVRSWFQLKLPSALTVDNITVVAGLGTTGQWIRDPDPWAGWALQATWVVDPNTGNDEWSGLDVGNALQTHNEYYRRVGVLPTPVAVPALQGTWYIDPVAGNDANSGLNNGVPVKTFAHIHKQLGGTDASINSVVNIHLMNDAPGSDPLIVDQRFTVAGLLRLVGEAKAPDVTDTIATYAAIDRSIPRATQITAVTTAVWTTHVGKRIRLTSGANAGAYAWIMADLGAGVAQITPFQKYNPGITMTVPSTATIVAAAPTDTFVIEQLYGLGGLILEPRVDSFASRGGANASVIIESVNRMLVQTTGTGVGGAALLGNSQATAVWLGCRTNEVSLTQTSRWYSCYSFGGAYNGGYEVEAFSCGFGARTSINAGGILYLSADCLCRSSNNAFRVRHGGTLVLGEGVGFFGCSGEAVMVKTGGILVVEPTSATTVVVYGNANQYGVRLYNGCQLSVSAVTPGNLNPLITVTGTAGDIMIDGYTSGPAWDAAARAWTTDRAYTWALAVTTVAGGGFGGRMCRPDTACGVVWNN